MRNGCQKNFARFAAMREQTHVNAQTAIDWAALGPSAAQRDARLKAVCRFARYIRIEDNRHEAPPANHFGARKKRRPPHIYSPDEISLLIIGALQLRPRNGLRSQTYATLIALLATTGLRISEALRSKSGRHQEGRPFGPGDEVQENPFSAAARYRSGGFGALSETAPTHLHG